MTQFIRKYFVWIIVGIVVLTVALAVLTKKTGLLMTIGVICLVVALVFKTWLGNAATTIMCGDGMAVCFLTTGSPNCK